MSANRSGSASDAATCASGVEASRLGGSSVVVVVAGVMINDEMSRIPTSTTCRSMEVANASNCRRCGTVRRSVLRRLPVRWRF